MSQIHLDPTYASRCSEKTLQSEEEGFFLSFADNLAEIAGKKWIEKSFAKLKSDREKLDILFKYEPIKNSLTEVLSNVQQIYRKKSSEIAKTRTKDAEKSLEKNDLIKSLALYSQAVLRSQLTGENTQIDEGNTLSLAIFGRSQVLMDLDRYDYALADIQMALKENLPEHLKGDAYFKLAVCYKAVNEDKKANVAIRLAQKMLNGSSEILMKRFVNESIAAEKFLKNTENRASHDTKISGRANKAFPNAAQTLDVKESPEYGRHMVCKGKIKTGDTLVVEAPYAACLTPGSFGSCCQHCFKRLIAPVGCPVCSNVAFCSVSCRDEALKTYHKYECKMTELLLGSGVSVLCHLALRMITQRDLKDNLMLYENKKNEHVFSLCTNREKRSEKDFFRRTVMAAFLLRCLQKVDYFGKEYSVIPSESEIKIGEMLLFNLQMLQFNAHEIYEKIYPGPHRFKGAKINNIGVGLYPTVALFNHQCYPSVTRYFVGKNIIINSIRPLENGEIVAENYGPMFTKKPLAARKNLLMSRYWFDCQCPACVQTWPVFDLNKEETSVRLRCPKRNCGSILSTTSKDVQKCSSCNEIVKLEETEKKLEECVEKYHIALKKMYEMHTTESIEILKKALDTFHEIALVPHKETHLAEETLRACYADFGNTFEFFTNK